MRYVLCYLFFLNCQCLQIKKIIHKIFINKIVKYLYSLLTIFLPEHIMLTENNHFSPDRNVMQYQKEEVRNRILRAALKEFSSQGYYRAKMLQISSRAKVPIGNLYKYFPSKESLFEALVDKAANQAQEMVDFFLYRHVVEQNLKEHTEELKYVSYAVSEYIKEYKVEFLMILEKSFGSNYEGFYNIVIKRIAAFLPVNKKESESLVAEVLAKGLLEGIIVIAKKCPKEDLYTQISSLLLFYFHSSNIDYVQNIDLPANDEVLKKVARLIEKNPNKLNKIV